MNTHAPALASSLGSPSRPGSSGFTLIELLVTIALVATLLAISLPSMARYVASVRLTTASNEFFSALVLARSEAIKRSSRVVLCKSADGATCAAAGGWEQGWIVFDDANDDGVRDADERLIAHRQMLEGGVRMTSNLNVARYISFTPSGNTQLVSGAFQAGTVTICRESASAAPGRQIVLSAVGRPRIRTVELQSC